MQPKRAIILYRVSTDRQELDAQKDKCRKFCHEQGFQLLDEVYEEGVSGYKNSLKDRPEVVNIIARSERKEFDVLIVFMYDRLGRREGEVPFLIQQLAKNEVEIYTADSGTKIHSDTHVDKFMNYMHSWVAEYESIKTSIRVKNTMDVMNRKGEYTGGEPPFGYETYQTGEVKDNGKVKYDIRINKEESEIVKLIFDLVVKNNYGGTRIANYLNEHGYKNRVYTRTSKKTGDTHISSGLFRSNSITRMIKNSVYIGRQRYNMSYQTKDGQISNEIDDWKMKEHRPELQIISDSIFHKANEIVKNRTIKKDEEVTQPTNSKLLLSGMAYCGTCGTKLKVDYSVKNYTRKTDGKVTKTYTSRYSCPHGRNYKKEHGKINFSAIKYENKVEDAIFKFVSNIDSKKLDKEINKFKEDSIIKIKDRISELGKEKEKCYTTIQKFEIEIEKSIVDGDTYKVDILVKGIKRNEERIDEIKGEIEKLNGELLSNQSEIAELESLQTELTDWEEIYKQSPMDRRKVMIMNITEKIIFHPNGVEVKLKLPVENSKMVVDLQSSNNSIRDVNIQLKYNYIIIESKFVS